MHLGCNMFEHMMETSLDIFVCSVPMPCFHMFQCRVSTCSNAVFPHDVETLQVKPHPDVDAAETEAIAALRLHMSICIKFHAS